MIVERCTSRLPLRPLPLTTIGSAGRKPIRRNLFGAAPPGDLLRAAAQLLDATAAQFAARWNFDPIAEKPLAGDILWTATSSPVAMKGPSSADANVSDRVSTISSDSKLAASGHCNKDRRPQLGGIHKIEASIVSKRKEFARRSVAKKCLKVRLRQTKITEYGKLKKKLAIQSGRITKKT